MSERTSTEATRKTSRFPGKIFGVLLLVVAAASLAADAMIDHHGKFGIDGTIGFYAWFGALSAIVFAALGWVVGQVLGRADGYYDR